MSKEQFLIVVYDISNDRRRTRLHNVLLNYGTPVQYSVFECLLKPGEIVKMRAAVRRVTRPRVDQVRYYFLCPSCASKTIVTCGVEVLQPRSDALVVGGDDADRG